MAIAVVTGHRGCMLLHGAGPFGGGMIGWFTHTGKKVQLPDLYVKGVQ